jgi:hypothetical protein
MHEADTPQRESNVRFWGKADFDGHATSANSAELFSALPPDNA